MKTNLKLFLKTLLKIMGQILNKTYILAQIIAHKEQLKAMGAEKLGLFGSYARNQQTADSDIDFLIEFQKEKKTYNNLVNIGDFLEKSIWLQGGFNHASIPHAFFS